MELGLSQRDAAFAAGVSDTTWLAVEKGERVSERTLIGVERALKWAPGSADAVLAGDEPHELGGPDRSLAERIETLEAELAELKRVVYQQQERLIDEADRPGFIERALSQRTGRRPATDGGRRQAG